MTTAERLPKNMSQNNLLYARLRSRFCDSGDATLGERMLQASIQTRTVNASATAFSEEDTELSAAFLATSAAARPTKDRFSLFSKIFACFLMIGVFLCISFALYRMVSLPAEQSHNATAFSITSIDVDLLNASSGAAATEDQTVFSAAYTDFCTAFED